MYHILNRLDRAFTLTNELYSHIEELVLSKKIPNVPSNTIGEQAWCIIGARESYLEALMNDNTWKGFNCSLSSTLIKSQIVHLLKTTKKDFISFLSPEKINEKSIGLIYDLYEHEIQHHGQLIRFMYANKLNFPKSWNARYTV